METYSKCHVTGKTSFPNSSKAREIMLNFKHRMNVFNPVNNKRVKRRIGKPDQCRSYYCSACKGYHITSQKLPINMDKKRKEMKELNKTRMKYIKGDEELKDWKSDSLPFPDNS